MSDLQGFFTHKKTTKNVPTNLQVRSHSRKSCQAWHQRPPIGSSINQPTSSTNRHGSKSCKKYQKIIHRKHWIIPNTNLFEIVLNALMVEFHINKGTKLVRIENSGGHGERRPVFYRVPPRGLLRLQLLLLTGHVAFTPIYGLRLEPTKICVSAGGGGEIWKDERIMCNKKAVFLCEMMRNLHILMSIQD